MPRGGPNFPPALAIAPSAPRAGAEPWETDSTADIAEYGIAGRIWEAAFLLLGYLAREPAHAFDPPCSVYTRGDACVLELGAGVGTAGLAVAKHGTPVVLTDLPEVCPLLERNAARLRERACVRALAWGDTHAAACMRAEFAYTHVLCSDLVYFPELLAPLLRTLIELTHDGAPQVIIGYKVRSLVKEQPFWLAFGTWFTFVPVDVRAGAEWVPYGSRASHVGGPDEPAQDTFFVFVATRRAHTLGDAPPGDADLLLGRHIRSGTLIDSPDGADTFELLLIGRAQA